MNTSITDQGTGNLDALHALADELPDDALRRVMRQRAMLNCFIGQLAGVVEPDVWAKAAEQAATMAGLDVSEARRILATFEERA